MRVIIFTTYMVPENLQVYVKTYAGKTIRHSKHLQPAYFISLLTEIPEAVQKEKEKRFDDLPD